MILVIDNYDSFTFNLFQYIGEFRQDIRVIRNDALSVGQVLQLNPDRIVISPGPGYPKDAGICTDLVKDIARKKLNIPVLGICLGHQAICEAFGAQIGHAKQLMHGKQSLVKIDCSCRLFWGMQDQILVARYHSLAVKPESLPACLHVVATAESGDVMAVQHEKLPIYGLQFHPESIMTPQGKQMIENFLKDKTE